MPERDQDARKVIQVVKSKVVLTRLLSTKPKVQRLKIKNWGTRKKNKCGVRVTSVKVTSVIIALGSLGKVGVRN